MSSDTNVPVEWSHGALGFTTDSTIYYTSQSREPIRILFLPFVNVDAYTLNRQEAHGGCRRTNLRSACYSTDPAEDVTSCSSFVEGIVDLNRNHPVDWDHPIDMANQDEIKTWHEMSDCFNTCGVMYTAPSHRVSQKHELFEMSFSVTMQQLQ